MSPYEKCARCGHERRFHADGAPCAVRDCSCSLFPSFGAPAPPAFPLPFAPSETDRPDVPNGDIEPIRLRDGRMRLDMVGEDGVVIGSVCMSEEAAKRAASRIIVATEE